MGLKRKLQEQSMYMKILPLKNASVFRKAAAFIYLLIGRKGIGKLFYINKKCGSCKKCTELCPNKAVKIRFGSPFWMFKCKGCLLCAAACPTRAVEVSFTKFIGVFVLIFLPYETWIESLFHFKFNEIFGQIIGLVISFAVWGIGYVIALFVMDRVLTILYSFAYVKKIMNIALFKRIRNEINPLAIFPVILTRESMEKLRAESVISKPTI